MVSFPADEPKRIMFVVELSTEIGPDQILFPALLDNEPSKAALDSITSERLTLIPPDNCNEELPPVTVIGPVPVPNAVLLAIRNTPLATVVLPVKVPAALSVNSPRPCFKIPPVPPLTPLSSTRISRLLAAVPPTVIVRTALFKSSASPRFAVVEPMLTV
jgi:hypothetical protein